MNVDKFVERIVSCAEIIANHHRDYPPGSPVAKEREIFYIAARRTIHDAKQELKKLVGDSKGADDKMYSSKTKPKGVAAYPKHRGENHLKQQLEAYREAE